MNIHSSDDLKNYELFSSVNEGQFAALLEIADFIECAADEVLFSDGSPAEFLYVLDWGEMAIQIEPAPDHPINIFHVRQGMILGWSAVVAPYLYTGTCVAAQPSRLIRMNGGKLQQLCRQDQGLGFNLMCQIARIASERLHATRLELCNLIYWVRS